LIAPVPPDEDTRYGDAEHKGHQRDRPEERLNQGEQPGGNAESE
jgi:hypothetical protein